MEKSAKKFSIMALCMALVICLFSSCGTGNKDDNAKKEKEGKKLSVVTTVFPAYDWTKQMLGTQAKNADVTMLLDNGADLHSYTPSAKDIAKISKCDVFVYVGGESDEWVKDALKEAANKNMVVINLMDKLGKAVKDEEVKEGMQSEDEHHHENDKEEKEHEKDEHIWLSLKNAKVCANSISDALKKVDSDNKKVYEENFTKYAQKIDSLDKKYQKTVSSAKTKTLLFGDRFPFRYMVNDYGLNYFAAFVGCSAESEAGFKTVKFLSEKVDALGLKHIMTIEKNNHKIAKTIIRNTKNKNQDILTLDSMQSTTAKDVKEGATYLDVMTKNLHVLKKALN